MKTRVGIFVAVFSMILPGLIAADVSAAEVITQRETGVVLGIEIDLVRIADNFIILFDTSESMGKMYKDTKMRKIEAAKKILKKRNAHLPDLAFNAGLYSYTSVPTAGLHKGTPIKAYYPMKPYNKKEFAKAIDKLPTKAGGPAPIQRALRELDRILGPLPGRTVVFIFSDGQMTQVSRERELPVGIAKELAVRYDVCFVVVGSAESAKEKRVLENVAWVNECSRLVPFDALLEDPDYVEGALYAVEERLVEKLATDEKIIGCRTDNILFDHNKSEIKPEFYDEINTLGKFLQENPKAHAVLAGFSDNTGSKRYCHLLSRHRVENVRDYLMKNSNIDEGRIVLHWYGQDAPVASNRTEKGRSKNRRVICVGRF